MAYSDGQFDKLVDKTAHHESLAGAYGTYFDYEGDYFRSKRVGGTPITKSSLDPHQTHMRMHILPYFGNMKLKAITREDVVKFRIHLIDYGNHVFSTLRVIFDDCIDRGLISKNPIGKVAIVKGKPRKRDTLRIEEIHMLFNGFWTDEELRLYSITGAASCEVSEPISSAWGSWPHTP